MAVKRCIAPPPPHTHNISLPLPAWDRIIATGRCMLNAQVHCAMRTFHGLRWAPATCAAVLLQHVGTRQEGHAPTACGALCIIYETAQAKPPGNTTSVCCRLGSTLHTPRVCVRTSHAQNQCCDCGACMQVVAAAADVPMLLCARGSPDTSLAHSPAGCRRDRQAAAHSGSRLWFGGGSGARKRR